MSKRRRRKKKDEGHISESWLIPYADILTLCLALFIVLYSMSAIDAKKFQALSESFSEVFTSGTGIFDYPAPIETPEMKNIDKQDQKNKTQTQLNAVIQDQKELKEIQQRVNTFIEDKNLDNELETSLTDEGLLVSIRDNVLFESGSATVRKEDKKLAKEISNLLVMDPPRDIVISGHTDNVPIHNSEYKSNWELSVMRAVNFMKVILENDKLDPSHFSAKGHGEYKPRASNKTAKGRALNRRVEILIMPRNTETPD